MSENAYKRRHLLFYGLVVILLWGVVSFTDLSQFLVDSVTGTSSSFPRIFIESSTLFNKSGGPEAMLQLALAFFAFAPGQTHFLPFKGDHGEDILKMVKHFIRHKEIYKHVINSQFLEEYPEAQNIPIGHKKNLRTGDILIIPEMYFCPEDLVARGVHVYIWVLGANRAQLESLTKSGCSFLSHNYWLSHNLGVNIPSTSVLRPYLTPSLIPQTSLSLSQKEDLVLVDNDTPPDVVATIMQICQEIKCNAIVVKGYKRPELVNLYSRAKVVIDWCMRGSERMPIEAVLRGAVLLSSDCECVQDRRDFPIPSRNVVPHITNYSLPLKTTVQRVLSRYVIEYEAYEEMRTLYSRNVSATSLEKECRQWYYVTGSFLEFSKPKKVTKTRTIKSS